MVQDDHIGATNPLFNCLEVRILKRQALIKDARSVNE